MKLLSLAISILLTGTFSFAQEESHASTINAPGIAEAASTLDSSELKYNVKLEETESRFFSLCFCIAKGLGSQGFNIAHKFYLIDYHSLDY